MVKLGRYKAQGTRLFPVEDGEVEITSTHSLVLRMANGYETTFHRFFAPRGSYPEWRAFCRSIERQKNLSQHKVFELARKYHIEHMTRLRPKEK